MIEQTIEELTPIVGTRPACRALGAAPATIYRRRRPPGRRPHRPRPVPARALTDDERQAVLDVLHSERFVDAAPAQVWATLLDEGRYLASQRTMYRLLAARHGGVRERRDQLTHPGYARPELLAERPNELWSWDISKLKGPAKWTCFYLYVILDVFSRYAVGWTVQHRENAPLAKALIAQSAEQQQIPRGQLTVHADRGSAMRSKPVAFLLADLGVLRTHSRPYTSTDNPYSEAQFKTLKYRPEFPDRFQNIEQARAFCRQFFQWYNHSHRHSGDRPDDTGRSAPRPGGEAPRGAPARPRRRLRRDARALRPPTTDPARATDRRVDQQANRGDRSLNSTTKRLKRLDRLRPSNFERRQTVPVATTPAHSLARINLTSY
jgi:putative transposase